MTAPERIWVRTFKTGYKQATLSQQPFDPAPCGYDDAKYIRADLAAVQTAQVRVKPLVWSDRFGPNSECRYDHITADSALGLYRMEWKGWKDLDSPTVCCDEAFIGCYNTIQSAKSAAQADYEARILAAIEPQPDPRDEVIARLVEALMPSGGTKAAYTGEIKDPDTKRMVSWTAIKMIMAMISARADIKDEQQ